MMMNLSAPPLKSHFSPATALRSRTLATAIVIALGGSSSTGFASTVTQIGAPGAPGRAGGNATANSSSSDLDNTAIATGGNGGDTWYSNGEGGKGGTASASATSQSSSGNANVTASSQAVGGNGGLSYDRGGAWGGNATAYASSIASGSGGAEVNVSAQGGNAGTDILNNSSDYSFGGSANATFTAQSTSGPVKATVTARGGNGGATTGTGRSGLGGSATLSNTSSISTTGSVNLSQTAYGGNAGAVLSGSAGSSGAGSSTLNVTADNASSLIIDNRGYGGTGANRNNATEKAGNGGSGGAVSAGTSATASLVSVSTLGKGGAKGSGSGGAADGNNGSASAHSTAIAGAGAAIAKATAEGRGQSGAKAQATGAISSSAEASSIIETYDFPRAQLRARAASNTGGATLALTGQELQLPTYDDTQNQATAIVSPDYYNTHTMFDNTPSVGANFNVDALHAVLGLARLGAGVETASTDSSLHLFSSSVSFSLDMSLVDTPQHLLFGMIEGSAQGSGFQTLRFHIDQEGSTVIDQTFVSLSAAETYFNDKTLDLGEWWTTISSDNILDLTIYLDVAQFGSSTGGFKTTFMFGNSTIGAGPSQPFPTVPVPGAFWLFGSALAGLLGYRSRFR